MRMEKYAVEIFDYFLKLSSKSSPIKDKDKTRKNIAKPGYKAVHQIPVGNAIRAKFKSLPHSGTLAGTPNPKNPKLPRTSTESAAFNVNKTGKGVITFGNIYLIIIALVLAPDIVAAST